MPYFSPAPRWHSRLALFINKLYGRKRVGAYSDNIAWTLQYRFYIYRGIKPILYVVIDHFVGDGPKPQLDRCSEPRRTSWFERSSKWASLMHDGCWWRDKKARRRWKGENGLSPPSSPPLARESRCGAQMSDRATKYLSAELRFAPLGDGKCWGHPEIHPFIFPTDIHKLTFAKIYTNHGVECVNVNDFPDLAHSLTITFFLPILD